MNFTVTINLDNDAFKENLEEELSTILHALAFDIECCKGTDRKLRDSNGNIVGSSVQSSRGLADVAAYLRGMRNSPYTSKDVREQLKPVAAGVSRLLGER